ncbi:hypothetical protein GS439_06505 [Rhodococcus hoagii]|nr:hypothetical protein [Prescottella equi]NKT43646.1 hypothetical protein [Prescottella equi]
MRDFLYLDNRLVDQFLAQVEDGLFDDEREREARKRGRGANLDASVGNVRAGVRLDGDSETDVERVRRQTPESRYNRLHQHLELASLNEESSQIYGALKPRLFVEAECYVDVPSVGRALADVENLTGVLDLMSSFSPGSVDADAPEMLKGLAAVSRSSGGALIATAEIRMDEPTLVFKLDRTSLRVPVGDLEGDAVVVGMVQKKWPEGEQYPLLTIPGINLLSRADRRKMGKGSVPKQDDQMVLPGPAVSMTVVAIYR